MERLTEDGTIFARRNAWRRTERLTKDWAIFASQNDWQRTKRLTQGGTVDAGLNSWRKTERLTQDSKLDGRRSAWRTTRNAQCSSLYFVAILYPLSLNARWSLLFGSAEPMDIVAATNWRSRIDVHKPTLTNRRSRTDAYLLFASWFW